MKSLISLLALGTGLVAAEPEVSQLQRYQPPLTVGHVQLEAEKYVSGVSHSYQAIDAFLREAHAHLPSKKEYTKKDALNFLYAIHNLVTQRSPRCKEQEFLSRGLKTGVMDCDIRSALYLTAADAFNFPMVGVMNIPEYNHMWIRWKFPDGTYINWESTTGGEVTDEQFARSLPNRWGSPRARQQVRRPLLVREYDCEQYAAWVIHNTKYDRLWLPSAARTRARAEIEQFFELYRASRAVRRLTSCE